MIHDEKLENVTLNNATGLPSLPPMTLEDEAIGSINGWVAMVNPRLDEGDEVVSRAWGGQLMSNDYGASVGINYGTFPNGQRCIDVDYDQRVRFNPPEMQLNPDAWSVVVVVLPRASDNPGQPIPRVVRPNTTTNDDSTVSLNVGWRAGSAATVEISEQARSSSGNPTRLAYTPSTPLANRATPSLLIYTGSVDRGLSIYDGGELVATNPDDTRPIEHFLGDGQTSFYHNCEGQLGPVGIMGVDLNSPQRAGDRQIISEFLLNLYGIPEGAQ